MMDFLDCLGTEVIFTDSFDKLGFEIGKLGNNVIWVCDSNTARMVRPLPEPNVILESGENAKTLSNVERIINTALEHKFDSKCTFLALGGGVVCDITALAASMYKGGCNLVFVPTTVTAMTDACIGGKNGINYKGLKNSIGTDYCADRVFVCIDCLKSLNALEYNNGLSGIIRSAFLTKEDNLLKTLLSKTNKILSRDTETIRILLEQSLMAKADILNSHDIKMLDVGNALSDAFESLPSLKCTHGQAIAWGVCKTMQLAVEKKIADEKFADSIIKLYKSFGYKTDYRINRIDWFEFRKILIRNGYYNTNEFEIIMLKERGNCERVFVSDDDIIKLIIKEVGF